MALAPEQTVQREQYVALIGRSSFSAGSAANTIPATTVAAPALSNNIAIEIPAGEAIRIVSLAFDFFGDGAHPVSLECGEVLITGGTSGTPPLVRSIPIQSASGQVINTNGTGLQYTDGELIYWNDYSEEGGIPPALNIQAFCDVSNAGAAAATFTIQGTVLIERFTLIPQSAAHVGYP